MPPPRGLVQQLDQHLHHNRLFPRRARLLIAVSGGADSVALLRLLHQINQSHFWNWDLHVAHIDHGIRGHASHADARFVRALAGQLDLPFHLQELALSRSSSEEAARTARLAALAEIAAKLVKKRMAMHAVVMAHHADDQAETVLMRLFRGTGLDGLSGMSAATRLQSLLILRPLLHFRRAQLRAYLESLGQPWREDHTNTAPDYLRNRVRHELVPVMESLYPHAVSALSRLAQLAAEAAAVIDAAAERLISRHCARQSGRIVIPRRALRRAPPAVAAEALRMLVESAGGTSQIADFHRLREALRLAQDAAGNKHLQLGRGLVLSAAGGANGALVLARRSAARRKP